MYKQLYKEIIDNAKSERRTKNSGVYYESHHIVPEFMFKNRKRRGPAGHLDGDPNSVDNIVLLTFQEHLMAHYYLYEILKDTRYGYSAGSALQFFFIKATGNHIRQRTLSDVDEAFLNEMSHLRTIGIKSISKARRGKMPVVDSVTKQIIGSVPVDHTKVLSGEWVHHSKGKKSPKSGRNQKGSNNTNYRIMNQNHIDRIFQCAEKSIIDDGYFSLTLFSKNIKMEFSEFKKVSTRWIFNHFKSPENLINEYNKSKNANLKYNPYYRSKLQRLKASTASSMHAWITNGIQNVRILKTDMPSFLMENEEYRNGRTYD